MFAKVLHIAVLLQLNFKVSGYIREVREKISVYAWMDFLLNTVKQSSTRLIQHLHSVAKHFAQFSSGETAAPQVVKTPYVILFYKIYKNILYIHTTCLQDVFSTLMLSGFLSNLCRHLLSLWQSVVIDHSACTLIVTAFGNFTRLEERASSVPLLFTSASP